MPIHYKNIPGYFDFENIYQFMVKRYQNGGILLELGSWLGKSTCFMAELIKENNAHCKFYTVDTFLGERDAVDQKTIVDKEGGSIYNRFLHNMKEADVLHWVTPLKTTSKEASKLFIDKSLDFVFLDCEHHYSDVLEDLNCWFPKIRLEGFICGHDYYQGSEVKTAVDEFFLGKYNVAPQVVGNSFVVSMEAINQIQYQKAYLEDIVLGKKMDDQSPKSEK